MQFVPGQRWISETAPELGLGLVLKADTATAAVTIFFPASKETLTYAAATAPLRRVTFAAGDKIELQGGATIVVADVREGDDGLLTYIGSEGEEAPESELGDLMGFHQPDARLLGGRVNSSRKFRLRRRALDGRYDQRGRRERGLLGARMELVPHQLFIADEVGRRHAPRVLLADEVGLGKTIEACLILHRKLVSGRASRALILVPEPLVHQWFVELLRRFNLKFAIYDEARCAAAGTGGDNPFLDTQLVLAPIDLLAGHPGRAAEAAEAGWDVVIVDEAHHLGWSKEGGASPEYAAVEAVAGAAPSLLLLTATPGQMDPGAHFARLRLLDPERFSDFDEFVAEQKDAAAVSAVAGKLESGKKLTKADTAKLEKWLGGEIPDEPGQALRRLLDLHGTGRVLFRNRRARLGGFPERVPQLAPLDAAGDGSDPRVAWLLGLLDGLEDDTKVLVIGKTRELAEEIQAAVEAERRVKIALFHEGLELVQRDRNAAYFAEADGARLLICSEIGSEGRNFQFAHHLVLWDLPDSPSLLEQRIGRLDRIGQNHAIQIHVPFVRDTPGAALARWYHEGLNAFSGPVDGAYRLRDQFRAAMDAADPADTAAWDGIIADTKEAKAALEAELEAGRDHLLEISSFDEAVAAEVVEGVTLADRDGSLESLLTDLFDQYGVAREFLGDRSYFVRPDSAFSAEAFPNLREGGGMSLTFDRAVALGNEQIAFVTWDHPIVAHAVDLILTSEQGSTAFAQIPATAAESGLIVECLYVLETVAPAKLCADRFLAPTPIQAVVDHHGRNITSSFDGTKIRDGDREWLKGKLPVLKKLVPPMVEAAEKVADVDARALRRRAIKSMETALDGQIDRLQRLAALGHPVRPEEVAEAEAEREALRRHLDGAKLRLDALRLVVVGG